MEGLGTLAEKELEKAEFARLAAATIENLDAEETGVGASS